MNKENVKRVLVEGGYGIKGEKRYKNEGYTLKTQQGTSVICYDSGKIKVDGKLKEAIMVLLESKKTEWDSLNNKVFIVYGHDLTAKMELENLLMRLGLQPIAIDNLPTAGNTIIEQLEKYIPDTNYGIVLMNPDDIGYDREHPNDQHYRARQNVIFEMGLLFSKLNRTRVMIIEKRVEGEIMFEMPSDIHGVLCKRYNDHVDEVETQLVRELKNKGYSIE